MNNKKFMVTMTEKQHENLKVEAAVRRTSMNEIVLNAVLKDLTAPEDDTEDMLELLVLSYHFIKGGPAKELEERLKKYALKFAATDDEE